MQSTEDKKKMIFLKVKTLFPKAEQEKNIYKLKKLADLKILE